jgi:hypothetical protein
MLAHARPHAVRAQVVGGGGGCGGGSGRCSCGRRGVSVGVQIGVGEAVPRASADVSRLEQTGICVLIVRSQRWRPRIGRLLLLVAQVVRRADGAQNTAARRAARFRGRGLARRTSAAV